MQSDLNHWIFLKARPIVFFAQTAVAVPFLPGFASRKIEIDNQASFFQAVNFFLASVGAAISAETLFSLIFKTEFSDWIHYSLPIFAAVTGSFTLYLFLKLMLTKNIQFRQVAHCFLIVAGSALITGVLMALIIIGTHFYSNWETINASPCAQRTIGCLLSGGKTHEYGVITLPSYVSFLPLLIFTLILYFTFILSTYLKQHLNVARWRTFVAALLSAFLLIPSHLLLVNGIYRIFYGS